MGLSIKPRSPCLCDKHFTYWLSPQPQGNFLLTVTQGQTAATENRQWTGPAELGMDWVGPYLPVYLYYHQVRCLSYPILSLWDLSEALLSEAWRGEEEPVESLSPEYNKKWADRNWLA